MRSFSVLFIILGLLIWGCGGGGSDDSGFIPTGKIIAVAERSGSNVEIKVGGTEGAAPPGSTVEVTNLKTAETLTTTAESDGSFDPTFTGSTSDTFVASINGTIVSDDPIGVTLISEAVTRRIESFGSSPTAIEIRGNRAYVLLFSNSIQIFDLDEDPPQKIGEIRLPPASDPVGIAFLDGTRAYVSNNIGQNVAMVNVQTMECETIITETPGDFQPCINPPILVPEDSFEDPWTGVAIIDEKLYVSNFNFDEEFQPLRNGFVTVIDTTTNEVIKTIELSAENAQEITVVGNRVYVVSAGDFFFDSGLLIPATDGAVDVIDPETDEIVATIPIQLNPDLPLVGSPNKLEPTPDGKFGYIGSGTAGVLFKVNLENNTLVRGTGVEGTPGPIIVTSDRQQEGTFDIEIRDELAFIAIFNTDQIFVMDTENDSIKPFPFIAPFPAGQKADDPDSILEGIQGFAIRPGKPGSDFQGADIFFVTVANSRTLGSINTALVLPPE